MHLVVVALGGCVGALCRYGLMELVGSRWRGRFPAGTLAVNVLGCLAIGALMAVVEEREALSPNARRFLVFGLLGSFTTFSTFGWDTLALVREGDAPLALANAAASVLLGVAAVALGLALTRWAL